MKNATRLLGSIAVISALGLVPAVAAGGKTSPVRPTTALSSVAPALNAAGPKVDVMSTPRPTTSFRAPQASSPSTNTVDLSTVHQDPLPGHPLAVFQAPTTSAGSPQAASAGTPSASSATATVDTANGQVFRVIPPPPSSTSGAAATDTSNGHVFRVIPPPPSTLPSSTTN